MSVIDGISQQVTATVPVTGASGVAVDPTTHQVYVTGNDVLSVLDGETYAVLATIPVGHFPGSVAVDPDTHRVYVGYGQGSVRGTEISEQRVTVVDGLEHVVVEDIPVTGCSCFGLEVDPRTHDVFVALYDRSKVAVLDGTNNANVEYIDVDGNSGSVAIDPGNQTAYIAHISNKITAIDVDSHQVHATVAITNRDSGDYVNFSSDVVVNPSSHAVYAIDPYAKAIIELTPENFGLH